MKKVKNCVCSPTADAEVKRLQGLLTRSHEWLWKLNGEQDSAFPMPINLAALMVALEEYAPLAKEEK